MDIIHLTKFIISCEFFINSKGYIVVSPLAINHHKRLNLFGDVALDGKI